MMSLSPAQCRAARALLAWTQRRLEAESSVAKKTIADFERGARNPFPRTLDDLIEAFQSAGIEFVGAEDAHGVGVRFKKGIEEPRPEIGGDDDDESEAEKRRKKLSSPIDPELAAYWADHRDQWAKLSETGRQVLSNMMFGSPEAADEAFGNDAR
jgi:transcriptional regulator with XRE-family HTH domain